MRNIKIFLNGTNHSSQIKEVLERKLVAAGFGITKILNKDTELIIAIGGDGSMLSAIHYHNFSEIPILGINTGHLGFFQELEENDIDEFISNYQSGQFKVQKYKSVRAKIYQDEAICLKLDYQEQLEGKLNAEKNNIDIEVMGLNEIVIKGANSHAAYLNIFIGDNFVERFIGDGVCVSTPAGSTALNYALGGGIVDPRLALLQVTPIAPINSAAYRSFTSSILLPPDMSIKIVPEYVKTPGLVIVADGIETKINDVLEIVIGFNKTDINILRFKDYEFWKTVKNKLL